MIREAIRTLLNFGKEGDYTDVQRAAVIVLQAFLLSEDKNTGLPCEVCGRRQRRLHVWWDEDRSNLLIQVSERFKRANVKKTIKGFIALLRQVSAE